MEVMTKRFSSHFRELGQILEPLGINLVTLNGCRSKYSRHSLTGWKKGVESDHVRIYKLKSGNSFAFGFNYTKVDPPYVMVTMKTGTEIQSSKYSEEKFRLKFNQFIKLGKALATSKTITSESLEALFVIHFIIGNEYDPSNDAHVAEEKIKKQITKLKKENEDLLNKREKLFDSLKKKKEKLETRLILERKETKIYELRRKCQEAERRLLDVEAQMDKELGISKTEDDLRKMDTALYGYNRQVEETIEKATKIYPKAVRDLLLTKLERFLKD